MDHVPLVLLVPLLFFTFSLKLFVLFALQCLFAYSSGSFDGLLLSSFSSFFFLFDSPILSVALCSIVSILQFCKTLEILSTNHYICAPTLTLMLNLSCPVTGFQNTCFFYKNRCFLAQSALLFLLSYTSWRPMRQVCFMLLFQCHV